MQSVKIGPSFFKKELLEYSDWVAGYIREALQNCIDAKGSTKASFAITDYGTGVKVVFSNNGTIMDENTIENKLLTLGESGKTGDNSSVGGFGKAKTLLYFSQDSYTIRSGNNIVTGTGGDYTITKEETFYNGTISEVIIPDCSGKNFHIALIKFVSYCQWSNGTIEISYNGNLETSDCSLHKGSFRKDLSFGKLYTNKSFQNKLIFRINGIPMFQKWVNFEGCVIIEASKGSLETMTSNRDGLKWSYQQEIESVIDAFTTNRSSILRDEPTIEVFGDTYIEAGISKISANYSEETQQNQAELNEEHNFKTQYQVQDNNEGPTFVKLETTQAEQTNETITEIAASIDDVEVFAAPKSQTRPTPVKKPIRQTRFMIFNDSGMALPNYAKPDNMGAHFKKLSETWIKLLVKLHELNGTKSTFGIGFTVGSASAQYITHNGIQYYLINPFEIVESKNTKHLKKKFNFINNKELIIMLAVHEYAHSFVENHDENFASVLTYLSELAMKNLKEFKRCF